MLLKKLLEILKTFDKSELKKLRRFISSDYFNTNESVTKLYKLLAAFFPGFDINDPRMKPEQLFRKIFGSRKFDEKTYRYLLSTLYSLVEKYLAFSLFEDSQLEVKKYTVDHMIERRLFNAAKKNLEAIESTVDADPKISGDYVYNKVEITHLWHQLYFLSNLQDPIIDKRIQQGELQLFRSVVEHSHNYQILLSVGNTYNTPIPDNLLFEFHQCVNYRKLFSYAEETAKNIKPGSSEELINTALRIYLCFMITMIDIYDEEYFSKMKDMVYKHSGMFMKPEQQNLHIMLTTCCMKKRKAISEEKYLGIFFEVIKNAVSMDLYTSYTAQYMDVTNFLVIFQTAIQLKEYDWAASFIRQYGDRISPEYSEDIINYAFSELFFSKKQYEHSLSSLSKVRLKLFRLKIPVKNLELRLYYELNYIEEAYSLIDSFIHFLTSNKKIRNDERKNHMKFVEFYREILKAKAASGKTRTNKDFKKELLAASLLPHKAWLIEKTA